MYRWTYYVGTLFSGEMTHNFNVSKPSIIFTTSKLYGKVSLMQADVSSIKKLVNMDEVDFPECDDTNFQYHDAKSTDTSQIMYSSGTTNLPKGIMITHKGWVHELEMFR